MKKFIIPVAFAFLLASIGVKSQTIVKGGGSTSFPLLSDGTVGAPAYSFSSSPTSGMYWGNGPTISNNSTAIAGFSNNGAFGLTINSTLPLSWGSSGVATPDTFLFRDGAANTVAQRNGTNAQTLNVYETFTDASNYSRLRVGYSASSLFSSLPNAFHVRAENAGTGTARDLILSAPAGKNIYFGPNNTSTWLMNSTSFLASTDNTFDVGASGANRPRTGYFGTSLVSPIASYNTNSILTISTNVITPTGTIHHLGAGLVKTITVPAACTPTCNLYVVPDAAFTTDATGNISLASTAVINKTLIFTWDGTKWNPSY